MQCQASVKESDGFAKPFCKKSHADWGIVAGELLNVWHTINDSELLWLASVEPRRNLYPFKRDVAWGEMSMCEAERRLLANALLDISNEWFVLLFESCIPLRGFIFVYSYVSESRYSFMGCANEEGPDGRGRYTMSQWRKGSHRFGINWKLALEIVQDITYYPKFKEFCTRCSVDEYYFPTTLAIQNRILLANRTLTWT
ncbi:unnamed protein product [Eruca vesicaria subsp. sativa]|uniref:Uncharacterized protein n=1 Tax=Eruca vesicaria subsp. sativa TaxID=29727 RepID=A0ABC8KN41_ERUVS|nr:unnamed protein product [Eruca vesicaria subsp. sativa]